MIEELKGKTLHGAEILDVSYGREEVPEEIQDMGRKFGHEPNTSTGLWFRAISKVKGKSYLADLRWTPDAGNECMIFYSDACGNVRSGKDVFSRSGLEIMSVNVFLSLVAEWAKEIKKGARK
jgi:hypothetical protein|nr:MAG TPA_asm: hypothetical protein [Bacteriophage sp.]